MTVVVIGSRGQLASHLKELLPQARFLSREDLDIADSAKLAHALQGLAPTHIVNAAAYTAVDRAESEPALAWSVNVEAPSIMARAANKLDIPLIHVSTDYVFNGQGEAPWRASDAVNPINVYGRTKLAGEMAVSTLCKRHWILRTSWVFSQYGNNFVKTMLRLAGERSELKVVADQRGEPTYAGDLAQLITRLLGNAGNEVPYGIHHATGGPAVSWKEFADAIIEAGHRHGVLAKRIPVVGIGTADYPTPAKRPANSVLEPSSFLPNQFDWQAGLDRVIRELTPKTN